MDDRASIVAYIERRAKKALAQNAKRDGPSSVAPWTLLEAIASDIRAELDREDTEDAGQ